MDGFDSLGGNSVGGYAASEQYAMQQNVKMASVPTMAQRIDMAVKQAEDKLAAVKRAKELFAKNPDLEELLNIMQRAHF